MAVFLTDIDQALHDLFAGFSVTTLDRGNVPVEVFVEDPDPEEYPERVFPSISIEFDDLLVEEQNYEGEDREEVLVNTGVTPYVATTREVSTWYRVMYLIHTFATDAPTDRALIRYVQSRKRPRDSIVVGGLPYWIFREGWNKADIVNGDQKEYHKIWTVSVLADIDNADTDLQVKKIHEVHFQTGQVETLTKGRVTAPVNVAREFVPARDARYFVHRTIAYDDLNFWLP